MRDLPRRLKSFRERNGSPRRSKSLARENKQCQPFLAEAFEPLFRPDQPRHGAPNDSEPAREMSKEASKEAAKEAAKEASREASKIEDVQRRLEKLDIWDVSADHIRDIMGMLFADGDPARTAEFIEFEQKAAMGKISPYDPTVRMVGAENRSAVTCYIDSLFFAMFAKMEAFEIMLKTELHPHDPRSRLVFLLRIWVIMLRTGKVIRTDLTKILQNAIADCGWADARMLEQQDTSEAFGFITETLQLPLLSLQVDLFHQGKMDVDDHKIVYERLLNLAVPADPDGKGIKLEDCLEEYFNAQVLVHRDSEVGKKPLSDAASHSTKSSLARGDASICSGTTLVSLVELTPSSSSIHGSTSIKELSSCSSPMSELIRSASLNDAIDPTRPVPKRVSSTSPKPSETRKRSDSLIQRIVVEDDGRSGGSGGKSKKKKKATKQGSTIVKAVTIPAWQFFRLIPWNAIEKQQPQSISEVVMNFDQRPVVGICLKRYAMTESGQPQRHNTYIDIPESLRLPHFMIADDENLDEDSNGLNTEYKLVLQSVVCHRGDSLQSGHYIAFARVAPKLLTGNRRHEVDPPPDYEEAQWAKFDDLETENRVSAVGDLSVALKAEMPYLLFYQIVPLRGACPTPTPTGANPGVEPPSYDDFRLSFEAQSNDRSNSMPTTPSRGRQSFIDDPFLAQLNRMADSKPPSIRLSAEVDRSSRRFGDGQRYGAHSDASISRRQSVVFSESAFANTPSTTTLDVQSLVTAPEDEPSTASRLSRAASRFTFGSKSRPVSQSSESRLSGAMSRLGFIRPSKEALRDASTSAPSFSFAAGDKSTESSKATSIELPHDAKSQQEQTHLTPKQTKHKRTKSKEKGDKHKGDQPDRECLVM